MLLSISFQLVVDLDSKTFERFEKAPILFYDNSVMSEKALQTIEIAQNNVAMNIYKINCAVWTDICKNEGQKNLPSVKATYMNVSYTMSGEEAADPEKQAYFISSTMSSMFGTYGTKQQFMDKMEQQKHDVYFVFQGPNATFLEGLALEHKNKIYAAYFESSTQKIIAFRYGSEFTFVGDYDRESVGQFIRQSRKQLFGKLDIEEYKQLTRDWVCLFVFDPRQESHKSKAKDMKRFIQKQTHDQTKAGREITFFHTSFQNRDLKNFFNAIKLDSSMPRIIVTRGEQFQVFEEESFAHLDEFLDGVLLEKVQMMKIGGRPQQKREQIEDDEL
ncbi:Hypothetical_protein [Hexamita inflata]|uniref:Hypothetical_protein n=1 Tax=Hexamita inflata TaxID=28002 RepID=A0AA86UXU7_9EUKA|nr:Hypothetical protein HINF_LOCUS63900 [Hexamita inflata]